MYGGFALLAHSLLNKPNLLAFAAVLTVRIAFDYEFRKYKYF